MTLRKGNKLFEQVRAAYPTRCGSDTTSPLVFTLAYVDWYRRADNNVLSLTDTGSVAMRTFKAHTYWRDKFTPANWANIVPVAAISRRFAPQLLVRDEVAGEYTGAPVAALYSMMESVTFRAIALDGRIYI